MPPTHNSTHGGVNCLEGKESPVQNSAKGLPHLRARRLPWFARPLTGAAFCVLLWAALLTLFQTNTFNQHVNRPNADAAYFAEMTQVFYLHEPPTMQYPAMHSRRILGPWLAAKLCSLTDSIARRKPAKPFHFGYYGQNSSGRTTERAVTYDRIMAAWQGLEAAAFLGIFLALFGILQAFQLKHRAPSWQPVWLALLLCCSPTLGRLYFNWPIMNDLVGISLGLLSILCLLKRRVILSSLLFGAGLLARENLALIYPCFLWIFFAFDQAPRLPKTWLLVHLILAITPYSLLCAFPVFHNICPFHDLTSRIHEATAGAGHDYLSLIRFHLRRPFIADHSLLRQSVVYWHVCGPLLFLTLRFYPWNRAQLTQDRFLWAAFFLVIATSFYVDRYLVFAVFPLALLGRHSLGRQLSPLLAVCLTGFYLDAVLLFTGTGFGEDLQVEFAPAGRVQWTALLGACALLLVALEPRWRARLASLRAKAALNPEPASSPGSA